MRVVFAANRALPLRVIANHLVRTLAELPVNATVLLRCPLRGKPAEFETLVSDLCPPLGLAVEWFQPERGGRNKVYSRDVDMVTSADKVIAYFAGHENLESGTGHVMEVGIQSELPVMAYVWDEPSDALDWLGETP